MLAKSIWPWPFLVTPVRDNFDQRRSCGRRRIEPICQEHNPTHQGLSLLNRLAARASAKGPRFAVRREGKQGRFEQRGWNPEHSRLRRRPTSASSLPDAAAVLLPEMPLCASMRLSSVAPFVGEGFKIASSPASISAVPYKARHCTGSAFRG
jgi:hypothetical protein